MDYKNLEMLSWLVLQFRRAGKTGITFDQLIDKLADEAIFDGSRPEGSNIYPNKLLSKRTFHNYLKELRDRFGIKIECDKRLQYEVWKKGLSVENNRYRYRLVEEPTDKNVPWTMPFLWAIDTSAALKFLQDSEENRKHVLIECSPSGAENVSILLDAIRQQKCIDISYKQPIDSYPVPYADFEPRGLVMKDHIWYLIGNTESKFDKIWPLYRLSEIKIKEIHYRPIPGFTIKKFLHKNRDLWIESLR